MSDNDFNDELDLILSKVPSPDPYSPAGVSSLNTKSSLVEKSSPTKLQRQNSVQGTRSRTITRSSSELRLNPGAHASLKVQRDLFGNVVSSSQSTVNAVRPVHKEDIPTHHQIDLESLKTYIYPINYEIRDYQFNIIEKCFYNNVLVALPTGLGKTFIAATIILNYFRWFPRSKIIFMAPTRPLVAQQIKACFNIIGLKNESAVLLDKSKRNRLEVWDNFRIFFTTPQVVENDLCNGIVDPKSVSLLIIDEAHKAKGNYAYNNVVKFLNRFNASFRILALTATPSSTVEGIKEIVDNLNINRIEIRTENSIDIIRYFKRKRIDKIDIDYNEDEIIMKCVLDLSNAVEPYIKQANERHLFDSSDPMHLTPFKLLDISKRNLANASLSEGLKWSNHFLVKLLLFVATCFKKLKIYGFNNFKTYFLENYTKVLKSKNKMMHELFNDQSLKSLISYLMNDDNTSSHPKIDTLIEYLKNFFKTSSYENSKVIIFTEFRDSALEIVNSIESTGDSSLKPHIFIGQAPDQNQKKSKGQNTSGEYVNKTSSEVAQLKGMSQKRQKELIQDFKSEKFNILVATSIGEEGLDIGEVDLIVCYDSTRSPIKNVQRLGRTGRKRDGNILMLFSDNERSKFEKAMENYEWIQKYIMNNESELVGNSSKNRILPKGIQPKLEKKFIVPEEITAEDNDEIIKIAMSYMNKKGKKKAESKSKKNTKAGPKQSKIEKRFFMPENVTTGFQNVGEMLKQHNKLDTVDLPSSPELIDTEFIAEQGSTHKSFDDKEGQKYQPKKRKIAINSQVSTTDTGYSSDNKNITTVLPENIKEKEVFSCFNAISDNSNEASTSGSELVNMSPENEAQKHNRSEFDEHPMLEINDDDYDEFSDDEVLRSFNKSRIKETELNQREHYSNSDDHCVLATRNFQPYDGFLSADDKFQLYTNYYNPLPSEQEIYVPQNVVPSRFNGKVSKRFLKSLDSMKSITEVQGNSISKRAKLLMNKDEYSTGSCVEYLNKYLVG